MSIEPAGKPAMPVMQSSRCSSIFKLGRTGGRGCGVRIFPDRKGSCGQVHSISQASLNVRNKKPNSPPTVLAVGVRFQTLHPVAIKPSSQSGCAWRFVHPERENVALDFLHRGEPCPTSWTRLRIFDSHPLHLITIARSPSRDEKTGLCPEFLTLVFPPCCETN